LKRLPKPADYSVVRRRRIAKAMAKIVHAHRATYRNVSSGVGLSEDARFLGTLEIALDLEYGYTKLSSPGPVKRPDTRT
jgi:hypothetical protein